MKVCDLNSGVGQLTQAFTQLKLRWQETKEHWNDDNSRQFYEQFMREIPQEMQQLLGAVSRLSEVLEKAVRDCEDREEEV